MPEVSIAGTEFKTSAKAMSSVLSDGCLGSHSYYSLAGQYCTSVSSQPLTETDILPANAAWQVRECTPCSARMYLTT